METRSGAQGASSTKMRLHNQRLILQRLRRAGEASRADLARSASLTNTAVGEIVRVLEDRGLVRMLGKKRAGQRGQPATLLTLDPEGAYGIGVRLDRSRIETVLTDLGGAVLARRVHDTPLPAPARALELLRHDVAQMVSLVPAGRRDRIAGLGLARPYNLGSWLNELDLPRRDFAPWQAIAFGAELEQACGLSVHEENDGTAAAIAELFYGRGRALDDYLYLFIGPAIGAGIVLGGDRVRGHDGNAADIAVVQVAPSTLPSYPLRHERHLLMGRASVNALMRHLRYRGVAVDGPGGLAAALSHPAAEEWLDDCSDALVQPLLAARAILDVPVVIIDSDLEPAWIDKLIARTQAALEGAVAEASKPPLLVRGQLRGLAGALGAATLPLFFHYGPTPHRPTDVSSSASRYGGTYELVA